jgi:hypothetical protein
MRRIVFALLATAALASEGPDLAHASPQADEEPNGVTMPVGYRDWKLISVAREEGKLDDLRAILGNDIAIKASREGGFPFPDGAIIARLAWSFDSLAEGAKAFGQPQSHVAGLPKNGVQFMVKDSSRFASTGGWGFAQFNDGKSAGDAGQRTCFASHSIVANRDFVFNRYATDQGTGGHHP